MVAQSKVFGAERKWETLKVCYCDHAGEQVEFEAEVVYPAEYLPDQGPRLLAHRCSNGVACSMYSQASCMWAGTNPGYDPFEEPAK